MPIRTASTPLQALAIPLGIAAFLLVLAGCSASGSGSGSGSGESDEPVVDEPTAACEIGHWILDVPDFESQARAFVEGMGIPVVDYALSGDGQLDIAADGIIDGAVSLRSTGIIDPGGVPPTPLDVASSYTFSGNWTPGDAEGTIDLTNWAQVADVGVPVDETGVIPEFFDFTDIPTVASECTADTLRLQGPDAPLSALWHRN